MTTAINVETDNLFVDLSALGLLSVTGSDARSFLQGQVTNDVNAINANTSHYSGYCNPKGRLLALFFAFQHQEQLYLSLDAALVPSIQKRLQMYVLRADVTLLDGQNHITRFGVAGNAAATHLASLFTTLPASDYAAVHHDGITIIKMPYHLPAYQLIMAAEQRDAIFNKLSTQFTPADSSAWNLLETLAGIPEIVSATQEAFVPQALNLDLLDAINFKKGCYTGQEIVARTHYLGKVKRRTLLGEIDLAGDALPMAGDIVTDPSQQTVGQVVRSCLSAEGKAKLLFECRLDSAEGGLRWQNQAIQTLALPYDIPASEK